MGQFRRYIVEYIGNVQFAERTDRRRDGHARELIDWIKGQLEARRYPADKRHELVHALRQALRQGDPASGGLSAIDAAGDGVSEWVQNTKGTSRDAPS